MFPDERSSVSGFLFKCFGFDVQVWPDFAQNSLKLKYYLPDAAAIVGSL
jgi:hypothetical protein